MSRGDAKSSTLPDFFREKSPGISHERSAPQATSYWLVMHRLASLESSLVYLRRSKSMRSRVRTGYRYIVPYFVDAIVRRPMS